MTDRDYRVSDSNMTLLNELLSAVNARLDAAASRNGHIDYAIRAQLVTRLGLSLWRSLSGPVD